MIRNDKDWLDASERFKRASYQMELAKAEHENARDALLALADNKEAHGYGVSVTLQNRKGTIDYKAAVAALAPDADVEPFRKPETIATIVRIDKQGD